MKTRITALALMMLFINQAFSSGGDHDFKRVYIGFSATPFVSYRYLHGNFVPSGSSQANVQGAVDYGNQHSVPEFGVNASFRLGINLNRWLAIESGVGYSLIRYRFNSNQYTPGYVYGGNLSVPADSFQTTDKETYQYMTVPVGLRFSIGRHRIRGVIAAGVNFDFLLKQQATYTYSYLNGTSVTNSEVQTGNFNKFNLSPYLGLGIDCHINQTFVLRIMPEAEIQGLKNINTPVTEYLWDCGLNVSFLFGL